MLADEPLRSPGVTKALEALAVILIGRAKAIPGGVLRSRHERDSERLFEQVLHQLCPSDPVRDKPPKRRSLA